MNATVLFVDDDSNLLDGLERTLKKENYQFLRARSGKEAQQILRTHHVDVAVLDECMPGLSGSDCIDFIRKHSPDTIRIMLTGHPGVELLMTAINRGEIFRFFTKPCNEIELALAIREALRRAHSLVENRRLHLAFDKRADELAELEESNPGISRVRRDATGAILLEE